MVMYKGPILEGKDDGWEDRLASIGGPLLAWYKVHARDLPWRQDRDPYRIWISEIMLQQTRVEAVKPYFVRFMERLPSVTALAQVEEEVLLKLWEGLGYYSRARNLKKAAMQMAEQYGGRVPSTYEELIKLPGIGSYTAGAIASIAYKVPVPAVDGNVLRVISRVLGSFADIARPQTKTWMEGALKKAIDQEEPGLFNQGLFEVGALLCTPYKGERKKKAAVRTRKVPRAADGEMAEEPGQRQRQEAVEEIAEESDQGQGASGERPEEPDQRQGAAEGISAADGGPGCSECPLAFVCVAREKELWRVLPVKAGKKARRIEEKTVLVLCGREERAEVVALRKRPPQGLLASLYEFPNVEGRLALEEGDARSRALVSQIAGVAEEQIKDIRPLGETKHVFSHVEWHMVGYLIFMEGGLPQHFIGADIRELEGKYPLPSAFLAYRKALSKVK